MKIFLSFVSTEFRSYHLKLANQLGALEGHNFEVKVHEDFQRGGNIEVLADYVQNCDLVIHLVGEASGPEPNLFDLYMRNYSNFLTLGKFDNASIFGVSNTQWVYHLARRFKKKVLIYLAKPEAPRDCGWPIGQNYRDTCRQRDYLQHILHSGDPRKEIDGQHQFVREVFYDLGLPMDLKVNNLPYKTMGTLFKGREDFIDKIRMTLSQAEDSRYQDVASITAGATVVSIHGPGGIGKTQASIEFAHKHADAYTALLFVRADSPEGFKANLGALCGPNVLDLAEKNMEDLEVQVNAVLHWLQQHPGWLLILDDVDTEQAAQAVEDLLGRICGAGQMLITSRIHLWSGTVESLALDVLTEADAECFLLERTAEGRRKWADDPTQARKLAVTLGQHPLALEQSGAMIQTNRMTFTQYQEQWQIQHDQVETRFDERLLQYPLSVLVTWQTSFDQLTQSARHLLHRLAWFSTDPIPEAFLGFTFDVPRSDGSEKRQSVELKTDNYDALANLEAHSLVTRADNEPNFSVHRLVQDMTSHSLKDNEEHRDLTAALYWINKAFDGNPQDVRTWSALAPLSPHALKCVQFADEAQITDPTARVLNQLGILFAAKAEYAQAEQLIRRALAINEQRYGDCHPEVANNLESLWKLLEADGRLIEAELVLTRKLDIFFADFKKRK